MKRWIAAAVILALAALSVAAGDTQARVQRGVNKVLVFGSEKGSVAYDLGPKAGATEPTNWTSAAYDDHAWDAAQVAPRAGTCLSQRYGINYLFIRHTVWGTFGNDHYLFRHVFTVPQARGYFNSTVEVATGPQGMQGWLNGQLIFGPRHTAGHFIKAVDTLIRPGANVLAIVVDPNADPECSALAVLITVRATDIQTGAVPVSSTVPATSSTPAGSTATLFGHGPEIHLSPSYATGTSATVAVAGLGWQPGQKINVYVLAIGGSIGGTPLATATTDKQGRFSASLMVTNPGTGATPLFIVAQPDGGKAVMTPFLFE